MTSISYEADAHRIRVAGVCREAELERLADAVEAFQQLTPDGVIVDLTGVTELSAGVAEFLLLTQSYAKDGGAQITLLRRSGDPADQALAAVQH